MCTSAPPSSSAVTSSPVAAFTSGGPPRKIVPGAFDDDRLVRHRRHVRAAGRARAHHDGDLRDALGRHARLVEEDAAEVLAIGKDLGLQRQERAAGVDEVDARQPVLERDLLRAQVLLDGDRIVRAAFDRRVVGDDQHFAARHAADAGDDARPPARRRRTCRSPRAATARETAMPGSSSRSIRSRTGSLPCCAVPLEVFRAAALPRARSTAAQLGDELLHAIAVGAEDIARVAWTRCARSKRCHPQQSQSLKPQSATAPAGMHRSVVSMRASADVFVLPESRGLSRGVHAGGSDSQPTSSR